MPLTSFHDIIAWCYNNRFSYSNYPKSTLRLIQSHFPLNKEDEHLLDKIKIVVLMPFIKKKTTEIDISCKLVYDILKDSSNEELKTLTNLCSTVAISILEKPSTETIAIVQQDFLSFISCLKTVSLVNTSQEEQTNLELKLIIEECCKILVDTCISKALKTKTINQDFKSEYFLANLFSSSFSFCVLKMIVNNDISKLQEKIKDIITDAPLSSSNFLKILFHYINLDNIEQSLLFFHKYIKIQIKLLIEQSIEKNIPLQRVNDVFLTAIKNETSYSSILSFSNFLFYSIFPESYHVPLHKHTQDEYLIYILNCKNKYQAIKNFLYYSFNLETLSSLWREFKKDKKEIELLLYKSYLKFLALYNASAATSQNCFSNYLLGLFLIYQIRTISYFDSGISEKHFQILPENILLQELYSDENIKESSRLLALFFNHTLDPLLGIHIKCLFHITKQNTDKEIEILTLFTMLKSSQEFKIILLTLQKDFHTFIQQKLNIPTQNINSINNNTKANLFSKIHRSLHIRLKQFTSLFYFNKQLATIYMLDSRISTNFNSLSHEQAFALKILHPDMPIINLIKKIFLNSLYKHIDDDFISSKLASLIDENNLDHYLQKTLEALNSPEKQTAFVESFKTNFHTNITITYCVDYETLKYPSAIIEQKQISQQLLLHHSDKILISSLKFIKWLFDFYNLPIPSEIKSINMQQFSFTSFFSSVKKCESHLLKITENFNLHPILKNEVKQLLQQNNVELLNQIKQKILNGLKKNKNKKLNYNNLELYILSITLSFIFLSNYLNNFSTLNFESENFYLQLMMTFGDTDINKLGLLTSNFKDIFSFDTPFTIIDTLHCCFFKNDEATLPMLNNIISTFNTSIIDLINLLANAISKNIENFYSSYTTDTLKCNETLSESESDSEEEEEETTTETKLDEQYRDYSEIKLQCTNDTVDTSTPEPPSHQENPLTSAVNSILESHTKTLEKAFGHALTEEQKKAILNFGIASAQQIVIANPITSNTQLEPSKTTYSCLFTNYIAENTNDTSEPTTSNYDKINPDIQSIISFDELAMSQAYSSNPIEAEATCEEAEIEFLDIQLTTGFSKWFLQQIPQIQKQILQRINLARRFKRFTDAKLIRGTPKNLPKILELRFHKYGLRIYFTEIKGKLYIFHGGDKNDQKKCIVDIIPSIVSGLINFLDTTL